MIQSKLVQTRGRAALAGSLVIWALISQAPSTALANDRDVNNRAWDARVEGTGSMGLSVRQGPGAEFPVQAVVAEGTVLHVVEGPRFDRENRPWYRVSGFSLVGSTGWSAGEFLLGSPPVRPDTSIYAAGSGAVAGTQTFLATVTAYTYQVPGNGAHGTITKSGTVARWGTVAVDPRVIPLGTRLMIEGFDTVFIAEDTGGGVRGDHVDVFFHDLASAVQFGVQRRYVTVLPGPTR